MPTEINTIDITYLEGVPSEVIDDLKASLLSSTTSVTLNEIKNRGPQNAVIESLPEVVALYIALRVGDGFLGRFQQDLSAIGSSVYDGLKGSIVRLLTALKSHTGGMLQSGMVTPFPPLSVTFKVEDGEGRTFVFPPGMDEAADLLASESLGTTLTDAFGQEHHPGVDKTYVFKIETGKWVVMTESELLALLRSMRIDVDDWK